MVANLLSNQQVQPNTGADSSQYNKTNTFSPAAGRDEVAASDHVVAAEQKEQPMNISTASPAQELSKRDSTYCLAQDKAAHEESAPEVGVSKKNNSTLSLTASQVIGEYQESGFLTDASAQVAASATTLAQTSMPSQHLPQLAQTSLPSQQADSSSHQSMAQPSVRTKMSTTMSTRRSKR